MSSADIECHSEWHWEYLALSYVVSCVGAFTSLQLMRQRTGPKGRKNWFLLCSASIALAGVGIFSMHFIGMHTVQYYSNGVQVPMAYDTGITIASLIACISVVTTAFYLCANPSKLTWLRILSGGVIAGSGVSVMHYAGMFSLIMRPTMHWNAGLVALSIIIGIVASTAALIIFFRLESMWKTNIWALVGCALVMGVAVNAMHYCAMTALTLVDDGNNAPPNLSHLVEPLQMTYICLGIALTVSFMLLGVTIYTAWQTRLHSSKGQTLRLHALIVNSDGQLLCTLQGQLPTVTIESQYLGSGAFDSQSRDFLRCFKASCNWQHADPMLRELQKRHKEQSQSVGSYSLSLFEKFLTGMKQLTQQLHLEEGQQQCVMWWKVIDSQMLVVFDGQKDTDQYTSTGLYRFAPLHVAVPYLNESFPSLMSQTTPADFVDDMQSYYRRYHQPLTVTSAQASIEGSLTQGSMLASMRSQTHTQTEHFTATHRPSEYKSDLKRQDTIHVESHIELEKSRLYSVKASRKNSVVATTTVQPISTAPLDTSDSHHFCVALCYSRVGASGVEVAHTTQGPLFLPYKLFTRSKVNAAFKSQKLTPAELVAVAQWSKRQKFIAALSTGGQAANRGARSRKNSMPTIVRASPVPASHNRISSVATSVYAQAGSTDVKPAATPPDVMVDSITGSLPLHVRVNSEAIEPAAVMSNGITPAVSVPCTPPVAVTPQRVSFPVTPQQDRLKRTPALSHSHNAASTDNHLPTLQVAPSASFDSHDSTLPTPTAGLTASSPSYMLRTHTPSTSANMPTSPAQHIESGRTTPAIDGRTTPVPRTPMDFSIHSPIATIKAYGSMKKPHIPRARKPSIAPQPESNLLNPLSPPAQLKRHQSDNAWTTDAHHSLYNATRTDNPLLSASSSAVKSFVGRMRSNSVVSLDQPRVTTATQHQRKGSMPNVVTSVLHQLANAAANNDDEEPEVDYSRVTADQSFQNSFSTAVSSLARYVGCGEHLTGEHLNNIVPYQIAPNVSLFVFVYSSMKPTFPAGYNAERLSFVPLQIFDLLAQSKFSSAQPLTWFRKCMADNLTSKTTDGGGEASKYGSVYGTAIRSRKGSDAGLTEYNYTNRRKSVESQLLGLQTADKQRLEGMNAYHMSDAAADSAIVSKRNSLQNRAVSDGNSFTDLELHSPADIKQRAATAPPAHDTEVTTCEPSLTATNGSLLASSPYDSCYRSGGHGYVVIDVAAASDKQTHVASEVDQHVAG